MRWLRYIAVVTMGDWFETEYRYSVVPICTEHGKIE